MRNAHPPYASTAEPQRMKMRIPQKAEMLLEDSGAEAGNKAWSG
jgi:hypothetical protein